MMAGSEFQPTAGALTDSTSNSLASTYAPVPRPEDTIDTEERKVAPSRFADPLLEALFELDKMAGKATALTQEASNSISRDLREIERVKGKATDDNFAAIAPRYFHEFEDALAMAKEREEAISQLVTLREVPIKHSINGAITALRKSKDNVGNRTISSVPLEHHQRVFQLLANYFDPNKVDARSEIVRELNPHPHVKVALRDMLLRVQEYSVELERLDNIRRDSSRANDETNGVRRMYLGVLKRCGSAYATRVHELSKEIEIGDDTFIRWLGEQRQIKTRMHILPGDILVWQQSYK